MNFDDSDVCYTLPSASSQRELLAGRDADVPTDQGSGQKSVDDVENPLSATTAISGTPAQRKIKRRRWDQQRRYSVEPANDKPGQENGVQKRQQQPADETGQDIVDGVENPVSVVTPIRGTHIKNKGQCWDQKLGCFVELADNTPGQEDGDRTRQKRSAEGLGQNNVDDVENQVSAATPISGKTVQSKKKRRERWHQQCRYSVEPASDDDAVSADAKPGQEDDDQTRQQRPVNGLGQDNVNNVETLIIATTPISGKIAQRTKKRRRWDQQPRFIVEPASDDDAVSVDTKSGQKGDDQTRQQQPVDGLGQDNVDDVETLVFATTPVSGKTAQRTKKRRRWDQQRLFTVEPVSDDDAVLAVARPEQKNDDQTRQQRPVDGLKQDNVDDVENLVFATTPISCKTAERTKKRRHWDQQRRFSVESAIDDDAVTSNAKPEQEDGVQERQQLLADETGKDTVDGVENPVSAVTSISGTQSKEKQQCYASDPSADDDSDGANVVYVHVVDQETESAPTETLSQADDEECDPTDLVYITVITIDDKDDDTELIAQSSDEPSSPQAPDTANMLTDTPYRSKCRHRNCGKPELYCSRSPTAAGSEASLYAKRYTTQHAPTKRQSTRILFRLSPQRASGSSDPGHDEPLPLPPLYTDVVDQSGRSQRQQEQELQLFDFLSNTATISPEPLSATVDCETPMSKRPQKDNMDEPQSSRCTKPSSHGL